MKMMQKGVLLIGLFAFAGCANPYAKNYQSGSINLPLPPTTNPYIVQRFATNEEQHLKHIEKDADDLIYTKRYFLLGGSVFFGTGSKLDALRSHARNVGSTRVHLYWVPSHTTTGAIPFVLSDGGKTVVTRRSGSTYGDLNLGYNETEISKSPPTYSTHWLPYTKHYYLYLALFMIEWDRVEAFLAN